MRGELLLLIALAAMQFGSSPHAWGTQKQAASEPTARRFIPTCVGNSEWPGSPRNRPAVHPHMRGELRVSAGQTGRNAGSSPHAWGTQGRHRYAFVAIRFIPTCVGNSQRRSMSSSVSPVHPHMRGELSITHVKGTMFNGSSPHAWGTRGGDGCVRRDLRFIPTCVGNSWHQSRTASSTSVHPHMRGELMKARGIPASKDGSSPHAWGTRRLPGRVHEVPRFIPTCVGNSFYDVSDSISFTVHPHMRGELERTRWSRTVESGSSPHAWGTRQVRRRCRGRDRFIPTCVGNSWNWRTRDSTRTVHPHMRGELCFPLVVKKMSDGSSPHAWGTLSNAEYSADRIRFIPTCVGNSG